MEKRIFVKKGQKAGGGRSYLKLLMWSVAALIILILLIPLGTRKKNGVEITPKQAPEKGVVFKEIPKSPPSPLEEEKQPDGIPGFIPFDKSPEAIDPSRGKSLSESQPAGNLPGPPEKATEAGHLAGKPDVPSDAQQKGAADNVTLPTDAVSHSSKGAKTALPTEQPPQVEKPKEASHKPVDKGVAAADSTGKLAKATAPPPKTAKPAGTDGASPSEGAKPAIAGPLMYSVQVGSFKEKSNAEEMQRNLQNKGYTVQVKSRRDPKLGQLYVVQLAPVPNLSKASTLVEQIRREDKVKPFIVKVNAGE